MSEVEKAVLTARYHSRMAVRAKKIAIWTGSASRHIADRDRYMTIARGMLAGSTNSKLLN